MIESALAGLIAGLAAIPHCASMCGPLAASCTQRRTHGFVYFFTRLAGYVVLGAIAGSLSAPLARVLPSPMLALYLGIAMAIALLWSAKRIFNTQSSESNEIIIPVSKVLHKDQRRNGIVLSAFFGFGTAVLPCGVLYAALLLAAAQGHALRGMTTMLSFGLISGLPLLGAHFFLQWLTKGGQKLRRGLALLLFISAILVIARPLKALVSGTHLQPAGHTCHS